MNALAQRTKAEFESNEAVCARLMGLLQLLANQTRFRILCLLDRGEFCVRDIVEVVNADTPTNISQQLKALTLAGLIERRRQERWIFYRLRDPRVHGLIGFLRRHFVNQTQSV